MVHRSRIVFARNHAKELKEAAEKDEVIMIKGEEGKSDYFLAGGDKAKQSLFSKIKKRRVMFGWLILLIALFILASFLFVSGKIILSAVLMTLFIFFCVPENRRINSRIIKQD